MSRTPDELRAFAQEHAPKVAEKITKLCGAVIAKGMQGILEEVCRIQAERDELLQALQDLVAAVEGPDRDSLMELIAAHKAIANITNPVLSQGTEPTKGT